MKKILPFFLAACAAASEALAGYSPPPPPGGVPEIPGGIAPLVVAGLVVIVFALRARFQKSKKN